MAFFERKKGFSRISWNPGKEPVRDDAVLGTGARSQVVLRRKDEESDVWTVFVSQSPQNKSVENVCGVLTLFCA